jgi:Mrp family chromosome partitioning ATPase
MSKILQAMRKTSLDGVSLNERLTLLDDVNLFPVTADHQIAEFEQLANSLIALHTGTTGLVVVFAATVRGEGNSYVSYNVARHLSLLLDRKVAWIDANFRSPQERLLNEEVNFRALLREPSMFDQLKRGSNFVLVANGDMPVKSTNLLKSNDYPELIARFQDRFYVTILDAPPILESVDVAHLAAPTAGVVIVVESRRLKHEVVQHGMEKLRDQNVRIMGTVLNKRRFDLPRFLYKRL